VYGEIALLYAEDLTVFIHCRNRFHPCRFWKLIDINHQDCYSWFGLTNNNLEWLFVHWRVPATFPAPSHHLYGGEECFIIFFYHMMKGVLFTDMAHHTFWGDPWHFSAMNVLMINYLCMTFYREISGRSLDQWIPTGLHTCACSRPPVEGSCPMMGYQPQGEFTPPNACNVIPPSDTPSASPWGDVSWRVSIG
jgi:hypothetical protein